MLSKSTDATIYASQTYIAKRLSVPGLVFSMVLFLAGIVILILSFDVRETASPLKIGLMALGFSLLAYSLYRLSSKAKETIYIPTKSITKQQSLFFDLKHLDQLRQCVSTGNFQLEPDLNNEASGNIRMDVILSQDNQFAAAQLFQFVPYEYKPITEVSYYTNGEAKSIANFIAERK